LIIPLVVQGVMLTFLTRKLMLDKYNTCPWFTLTYDSPEFEPETKCFANMERYALSSIDQLWQTGDQTQQTHLLCLVSQSLLNAQQVLEHESQSNLILLDISPMLCDDTPLTEMWSAVHVSSVWVTEWCDGIDAMRLARNFGIGLDNARRTLKAMTQWGVRTILNPTLSRWFQMNDWQLRYRHLQVDMFTNMIFLKVKSKRGNTCAQVFLTAKGWTCVYPMKKKSKAWQDLHDDDKTCMQSSYWELILENGQWLGCWITDGLTRFAWWWQDLHAIELLRARIGEWTITRMLDYWWVMCFTSYQLNWNPWIWIPFPVDSDCTLLCTQVDRTRYSSIASGNNCIVQLCKCVSLHL
jgi:hypothetical protein